MKRIPRGLLAAERMVKHIGNHRGLSEHDKRKLGIFNLLNAVFGVVLGIVVPLETLLGGMRLSATQLGVMSFGSLAITAVTMVFNQRRRYDAARTAFFILHPMLLTGMYILGADTGADLFFVCYGVLSVFFLQNIESIIFSFCLSLTCYFLSLGLVKTAGHSLETSHIDAYLFNRLLAIFFIFYGIFNIRNENGRYQFMILSKNKELLKRNDCIEVQKQQLQAKAIEMEQQAIQLADLNSLKNKLFSVISHDLRGPLYAMHNVFKGIIDYDVSPGEIKALMPEIARDLGETTGNIENLLHWAKGQMQSEAPFPQVLELSKLIRDVVSFLRLQLESKKLRIESMFDKPVYIYADREMINVVLRNLISNAIKFTPESGVITLGASEDDADIRVFVRDSGTGISAENLRKIEQNIHYTSTGTAMESGTGLGLMLCREFLGRNGGRLLIESQPGKGSTFSFVLPKGG